MPVALSSEPERLEQMAAPQCVPLKAPKICLLTFSDFSSSILILLVPRCVPFFILGRHLFARPTRLPASQVAPDVDLMQLSRDLPGLVGADLANIVNEAAMSAVRAGRAAISARDMYAGVDRFTQASDRGHWAACPRNGHCRGWPCEVAHPACSVLDDLSVCGSLLRPPLMVACSLVDWHVTLCHIPAH